MVVLDFHDAEGESNRKIDAGVVGGRAIGYPFAKAPKRTLAS